MLPIVTEYLSMHDIGYLRRTCSSFRFAPCVLAAPTWVYDPSERHEAGQLLDCDHRLRFLPRLPNLRHVHLESPKSLYGLQHITQVSVITLTFAGGLDYRPLRGLRCLQRLELEEGAGRPLSCLDELQSLSSLLIGGKGAVTAGLWQLSDLQDLELGADCSVEEETYGHSLPGLTRLKAAISVMKPNDLPLLQQLHMFVHRQQVQGAFVEARLGRLPVCKRLSSLTIQYTPSPNIDGNVPLRLAALQALPALQRLELWHCCLCQPLQLSALTAFTFVTQERGEQTRAAPVMRLCPLLRQLHVFIAEHSLLVSRSSLPDFSPIQPMHIKYTLWSGGDLVFDRDLLAADCSLPESLHLQLCQQKWPDDSSWGCEYTSDSDT